MAQKWIKDAVKGHKEGSLHRQIGLSENYKIPFGLLNAIAGTPIGKTCRYKSVDLGRTFVLKVTILLKRRAVLARTLKGITKKRYG